MRAKNVSKFDLFGKLIAYICNTKIRHGTNICGPQIFVSVSGIRSKKRLSSQMDSDKDSKMTDLDTDTNNAKSWTR